MKKLIYLFITVAAMGTVFIGCKDFLDVNEDPNRPTEVSPPVLLPSAEGSLAYFVGGDASRFTSVFVQYVTGSSRQFFAYNRYIFTEEDFNNLWNNMYADAMKDMDDLMDIAAETPGAYDAYGSIARILMAYSLGQTTDWWGDIPYDEAFQGIENLTPAYEPQQEIYNTIQSLLDEAISLINGDTSGAALATPFADDNIYNGDMGKWLQFANALKARHYIHLVEVDPANAQNALNAIAAGAFTDNSSDAQYAFSTTAPGPWYQYIEQRDDIIYEGYCIDTMIANGDPRYAVYIDQADEYWGTGYLGPTFAADYSPVIFMTYAEQKFIEAEAQHRLGDFTAAETALQEGIRANMEKYGIDDSSINAYIDANADTSGTGTGEEQLATIMYEKYVALFLNPEAWTDWRRTGYPQLTANVGVLSEIPRRFIYPTNENLYNSNEINQNSTLLNPRLWWDQF